MIRLLAVLLLAGASVNGQTITTETFGSGANAFSIDFVTIGNPGNAADDTGFGSVAYTYNLGKYEISRDQIEKANSAGGLGITLADMTDYGGNGANRPATGISWNEAARFVNYLNTSQGYQVAYNFTTSGANDNISLWGAGQYSGSNQYRHKDAYYFLPSRDEWYKGAYGTSSGAWFNFPTGSDNVPTAVSWGNSPNTAVYGQIYFQGPADVTYAGGLSPYGTMAQGGNAWEWAESQNSVDNSNALLGGSWEWGGDLLSSTMPGGGTPTYEGWFIGFRIASVPEPSSLLLLLAGGAVFAAARRRKVD